MKKYIKSLLCGLMVLSLTSCQWNQKDTVQDFDQYTQSLIPDLIGEESSIINSLYLDPQKYGIAPTLYEHSFMSEEDFQEAIEEDKNILEQLNQYDLTQMSLDQLITYDLLMDYVQNDLKLQDMYYLLNNNFDVNHGLHASLTLDLYFYSFRNKQDIDSFIHLLETTDEAFEQAIEFEKIRQQKGFGMSSAYLTHVIEQVETFNQGNHDYVLNHAYEQLDLADFLSDEEKQTYREKIDEAYEDCLEAYRDLEEDLKNELVPSNAKYLALADYEGGKEYYAYLIQQDAGFEDIEEYRAYLQKKKQEALFSFMFYLQANQEVAQQIQEGVFEVAYSSLTTMQQVLEYLEEQSFSSHSFPMIEDLTYEMEVVPESMQEIFLASAAYFLSPFDADSTYKEHMVLNGDFASDSYTTLAHEGIPGHMYQHNYFKQIEHNHLRDLLSNTGYQEAWATYVSKFMVQYCEDPKMAWAMELNNNISYLYILELDLMIHYDGISTQEALNYLMDNFGMDETSARMQYEQLIESPAVFVPYYAYYFRLMDLREACNEQDPSLSDHDFHQMILDLGPLPYPLLEKYVKKQMNMN